MHAGIGHNQRPPLGGGWRTYCWRKARAQLLPPAPLEVVRRRVRRAAELGLSYPDYASIVLLTGRDLAAWLLTSTALDDGEGAVRADAQQQAGRLIRCDLLVLKTSVQPRSERIITALNLDPQRLAEGGTVAPLRAGREAIAALVRRQKLPAAAVAMVGTGETERALADAARLAKFLPVERWLGQP